jgi:uncharacterized protein YjbI with pentapeptide repeats
LQVTVLVVTSVRGEENYMADQVQLDILLQGVEVWNEWREQNPTTIANLTRTDLSGALLTNANLTRALLANASLIEAGLSGADLIGANLNGANLSGANLSKVDLTGANLSGANLSRSRDLTQNQIEKANGDEQTKLPNHLKRPAAWS